MSVLVIAATLLIVGTAAGQPRRAPDLQWMDADGVKVPAPPAEHPRLYLRARDLDYLKRRVEHPGLRGVWQELQSLAGRNEQIRCEVESLRYLLTKDTATGQRALQCAIELMEKSKFDLSIQDITRPIGRLMVTGAIAYDWCYPLLTAELKKRYLDQLLRLAKDLECGYPRSSGDSSPGMAPSG